MERITGVQEKERQWNKRCPHGTVGTPYGKSVKDFYLNYFKHCTTPCHNLHPSITSIISITYYAYLYLVSLYSEFWIKFLAWIFIFLCHFSCPSSILISLCIWLYLIRNTPCFWRPCFIICLQKLILGSINMLNVSCWRLVCGYFLC